MRRCGTWVLQFSEFFSIKVERGTELGNELVFKYPDFDEETIKLFLDYLHGITCGNVSSFHLTELCRFLVYEGKHRK